MSFPEVMRSSHLETMLCLGLALWHLQRQHPTRAPSHVLVADASRKAAEGVVGALPLTQEAYMKLLTWSWPRLAVVALWGVHQKVEIALLS